MQGGIRDALCVAMMFTVLLVLILWAPMKGNYYHEACVPYRQRRESGRWL